ncbi:hypothetical protein HDU83_004353 [Entophlyctis luteolus]|nr:hypothetical protein HDU83_004353 [Entophlyctis luteolus]
MSRSGHTEDPALPSASASEDPIQYVHHRLAEACNTAIEQADIVHQISEKTQDFPDERADSSRDALSGLNDELEASGHLDDKDCIDATTILQNVVQEIGQIQDDFCCAMTKQVDDTTLLSALLHRSKALQASCMPAFESLADRLKNRDFNQGVEDVRDSLEASIAAFEDICDSRGRVEDVVNSDVVETAQNFDDEDRDSAYDGIPGISAGSTTKHVMMDPAELMRTLMRADKIMNGEDGAESDDEVLPEENGVEAKTAAEVANLSGDMKLRNGLREKADEIETLKTQLRELQIAKQALDEKKQSLAKILEFRANQPTFPENREISNDEMNYRTNRAFPIEEINCRTDLQKLENRFDSINAQQLALKSEKLVTSKQQEASREDFPSNECGKYDLTVDQLLSKLLENSVKEKLEVAAQRNARATSGSKSVGFSMSETQMGSDTARSAVENVDRKSPQELRHAGSGRYSCEDLEISSPAKNAATKWNTVDSQVQKSAASSYLLNSRSGHYGCESEAEGSETSPSGKPSIEELAANSAGFNEVDEEQIEEAAEKVEDGIEHIRQIKSTEIDFSNQEHVRTYTQLLASLSGQLNQFLEARATIVQFKNILGKQKASGKNLEMGRQKYTSKCVPPCSGVEQPRLPAVDEKLYEDYERTINMASQSVNRKKSTADDEWERTIDAKLDYSWVEPAKVDEIDVERELRKEMKALGAKNHRRGDLQWETDCDREKVLDKYSRELYFGVKDSIYRDAAGVISLFETEPYFLVNVFKSLQKLDSSYLRQKFLLCMNSLLEEREKIMAEIEFQAEPSADNFYNRCKSEVKTHGNVDQEESALSDEEQIDENDDNDIAPMDSPKAPTANQIDEDEALDTYNSFKSRISDCIMDLVGKSVNSLTRFTSQQISSLQNFLMGMMHAELDAMTDLNSFDSQLPAVSLPQETISTLLETMNTLLNEKLNKYVGLHIYRVQQSLITDSLKCMKEVLDDANLSYESIWAKAIAQEERKRLSSLEMRVSDTRGVKKAGQLARSEKESLSRFQSDVPEVRRHGEIRGKAEKVCFSIGTVWNSTNGLIVKRFGKMDDMRKEKAEDMLRLFSNSDGKVYQCN